MPLDDNMTGNIRDMSVVPSLRGRCPDHPGTIPDETHKFCPYCGHKLSWETDELILCRRWVSKNPDLFNIRGSDNQLDRDCGTEVKRLEEANIITSASSRHPLDYQYHFPIFDLDIPCVLLPSTTPGHYHLYVQHPMKWKDFLEVSNAMGAAGLLNRGWVSAMEDRGVACLRKPGVKK